MPVVAVIVPTVLGLGILFSLATVARDAYRSLRGPGWMSRRAGLQGRAAARHAVGRPGGHAPAGTDPDLVGRRSRGSYALWGTASCALATYLLLGSWGNYIGWTWFLESIAWIWLVFLAAVAGFATVGVAALAVAVRWDDPPAWTAPLLARTPLGRIPERPSVAAAVVTHPAHVRHVHRPAPVRPLGRQHITDAVALGARTLAGVWTLVALALLGWGTFSGRIPTTPEELDTAIADPAWFALYVLLLVSALAVYRFEIVGAVALVVVAALLGVLSAIQYPSWVALGVVAVFAVPAFLHWLAWQRDHHVHHLVRVAALTSLVVLGAWWSAEQVYAHYFGPTHPDSAVVALPDSAVTWAWAGGTTSRSTRVVAKVDDDSDVVRLAVSTGDPTDGAAEDVRWSDPVEVGDGDQHVARLAVDGLRPDTAYRWALEVDGRLDEVRTGTLRTLPEGPSSFTLAVAACARSGSNGAVFDAIRRSEPLVYLQIGDLHYANIGTDDPGRFRAALDQVLTRPGQAALYRSTSIAYTWDDHDYAANDGDATSPSRPAAGQVYRAWVPSHPLLAPDDVDGPIAQAFVVGRVRVVMTDTRSQRTPPGTAVGPDQQVLGAEQEAWFAEQLAEARDAGQVVLWAGSTPWIGEADPGNDTWAGFPDARRRLADRIAEAGMADRLVAVAGDAHMVALDDGSHTDYSAAGTGGFPLLQAAALDRPGSVKGGPYSGGTYPGGGQYGEVQVDDDGGPTLDITLRGRTWDGRTLVEETFTLPVG